MNFGVVVFDQAEALDFIGPWEMLTLWSKYFDGPANCLTVAEPLQPVICAKGMSVRFVGMHGIVRFACRRPAGR